MPYELILWDRINMPGRELGSITRICLPKVGDSIHDTLLDYEVIKIWRCGSWKDEEPERHTVVVKLTEKIEALFG